MQCEWWGQSWVVGTLYSYLMDKKILFFFNLRQWGCKNFWLFLVLSLTFVLSLTLTLSLALTLSLILTSSPTLMPSLMLTHFHIFIPLRAEVIMMQN